MNAYIYQAALWCEDCALATRKCIFHAFDGRAPKNPEDESTYDSDDYPKGPYPDGGGESDSPEHCDGCGTFLENPLTADGYAYVLETITVKVREWVAAGKPRPEHDVALDEWSPFYGIEAPDDDNTDN